MDIDIVVVGTYAFVMLLLGWFGMRRAKSSEEFLVAGRRLGPWMYMGTMAATVLGGASTIGTVRLGYQYGISGLWLCAAMGAGIIVLNLFLSKHILKLKVRTVNQVLEHRYNRSVKRVSSFIMFSYALMVCVVSFLAIGSIAQVILGLSPWLAILLGASVVVIYSTIGGMWSLTLTDMVQFLIKTVGMMFLLLPICYIKAGGWEGLQNNLPQTAFDLSGIGWDKIATYFVIYFFGILIGQDIWQRVFTARSEHVTQVAGTGAGVYCLVYGAVGAIIGMCAHVILPNISDANNAFAMVVQNALPPGVRGLVIAAALSAMMSTASAGLLAAATTLTEDVIGKPKFSTLTWNRLATLGVGLVAAALSLAVHDVLDALTIAYNFLVGGMLVPLLGAIYWRRSTTAGAMVSMVSGFVVCATWMYVDGIDANTPIYYGLAVSLASFVVISLLGKSEARNLVPSESGV